MTLGNKIQELRKNKLLSQEAFAEIMGVTRQSVSKWELDQSYPAVEKLVEIADFFEITLDELLREQDKPADTPDIGSEVVNTGKAAGNDTESKGDKIAISKEYVWYFTAWAAMIIIVVILFGLQQYFAGFLVIQIFIWTTVILKIINFVKGKNKKAA